MMYEYVDMHAASCSGIWRADQKVLLLSQSAPCITAWAYIIAGAVLTMPRPLQHMGSELGPV